jgi:hypothetical protein
VRLAPPQLTLSSRSIVEMLSQFLSQFLLTLVFPGHYSLRRILKWPANSLAILGRVPAVGMFVRKSGSAV